MSLLFSVILKLCSPQASSMTKSSKPNLWHLKRSLTIRHLFTPPMACSASTLKEEIERFDSFCSSESSLPFGFFVGIITFTFSGLCPKKPVSCHNVIPDGK